MKIRAFFGKLRGKFLLFFAVGMAVTVAVVSVISYLETYNAFDTLNGDIVSAEFNQITDSVHSLISNMERIMDAEFLYSEDMTRLAQYTGEGYISYIHTVNRLKEAVSKIGTSFPYIESVCFYIGDERIVATSRTNTREIYEEGQTWPKDSVRQAMAKAPRSLTVMGGVFADEMCLRTAGTGHTPLVMLYKSLYVRRGTITCAVSIYEEQLYRLYSGLTTGGGRSIRLLTADGTIISSPDKSEIGTQYDQIDPSRLSMPGSAMTGHEKQSQVNWEPIGRTGIVVLADTSTKRYTGLLSSLQFRVEVIFVGGILLTCLFFLLWLNRILRPLDQLIQGMKRAGNGDYSHTLPYRGTDEFSILTQQYNHMLEDLALFAQRQRATEAEIRENELRALRNQINPHFLYNTLNMIRWMARFAGAENIEACIRALGAIIVPLYKDDRPTCTLKQEIELLNQYLTIMNFRCNGRISFETEVPEELMTAEIPRFILQPLVENSIEHGFAASGQGGTILLQAVREGDTLLLSVTDDGVGMSEEAVAAFNAAMAEDREADGVGMRNVNRRIRLRCGPEYGVRLQRLESTGLKCVVRLPFVIRK